MHDEKEKARSALENAVWEALEAGMSHDDIQSEVAYVLENADD